MTGADVGRVRVPGERLVWLAMGLGFLVGPIGFFYVTRWYWALSAVAAELAVVGGLAAASVPLPSGAVTGLAVGNMLVCRTLAQAHNVRVRAEARKGADQADW